MKKRSIKFWTPYGVHLVPLMRYRLILSGIPHFDSNTNDTPLPLSLNHSSTPFQTFASKLHSEKRQHKTAILRTNHKNHIEKSSKFVKRLKIFACILQGGESGTDLVMDRIRE